MNDRPSYRLEIFLPSLIFLLAFGFALVGLNPTFFANDSPETVTACVTFGIPHPPGYPLHTLLGRLFSVLPLGHFPFRVNLFSAVMGACLCAGLYLFLNRKLLVRPILAFPFALLWITGATAYSAALSAKTGIYELTALFLLGILGALFSGKIPFAVFLLGLSFTNHWMSMVTFLPGFGYLVFSHWKKAKETEKDPSPTEVPVEQEGQSVHPEVTDPAQETPVQKSWEEHLPSGRTIVLFTLFLLGLTVYLVLPLRAHLNPELNWGNPSSLRDFVFNFFRTQYSAAEGGGDAQNWFIQWGIYLKAAFLEFPGLLLLALGGWILVQRKFPTQALGLLFLWASLVIVLGIYLNLPEAQLFLIKDYTLPAHLFILLFSAWGLETFLSSGAPGRDKRFGPFFLGALTLLLVFSSVTRFTHDLQTRYTYVHDYVLNSFKGVPKDSLYYAKGDGVVFPCWYFQWVEKKRTDLVAIGVDGLPMEWVRKGLSLAHPGIHIPFTRERIGAEAAPALMDWILVHNQGRPLYLSYNKTEDGTLTAIKSIPYGVAAQAVPKTKGDPWDESRALGAWEGMRLRNLDDPNFPLDHRTREVTLRDYAVFRNLLGILYEDRGDEEHSKLGARSKPEDFLKASDDYKRSYDQFLWAERWAPDLAEHPYNVGNALFHLGRAAESIPWYEKAIRLKPDYLDALFNAAVAAYQTGQYPKAGRWFDKVLELKPDHAQAKQGVEYLRQQGLYLR